MYTLIKITLKLSTNICISSPLNSNTCYLCKGYSPISRCLPQAICYSYFHGRKRPFPFSMSLNFRRNQSNLHPFLSFSHNSFPLMLSQQITANISCRICQQYLSFPWTSDNLRRYPLEQILRYFVSTSKVTGMLVPQHCVCNFL